MLDGATCAVADGVSSSARRPSMAATWFALRIVDADDDEKGILIIKAFLPTIPAMHAICKGHTRRDCCGDGWK